MLNSQCSILSRKEKRPHVCERLHRMRIEHWELEHWSDPLVPAALCVPVCNFRVAPQVIGLSSSEGTAIIRRDSD
jgi:hypothetical protein